MWPPGCPYCWKLEYFAFLDKTQFFGVEERLPLDIG